LERNCTVLEVSYYGGGKDCKQDRDLLPEEKDKPRKASRVHGKWKLETQEREVWSMGIPKKRPKRKDSEENVLSCCEMYDKGDNGGT